MTVAKSMLEPVLEPVFEVGDIVTTTFRPDEALYRLIERRGDSRAFLVTLWSDLAERPIGSSLEVYYSCLRVPSNALMVIAIEANES